MIIINKSGYLKYQDLKFKCALGKHGINKKKKEGEPLIGADLGQRHTKNGIKKKGRKRKRSRETLPLRT